jgi:hypothetical protein
MTPSRSVCACLIVVASATGGFAAELRTLKGEVIQGDLVSVTPKEIILHKDGADVPTSIQNVLQLNLRTPEEPPAMVKFGDVELTDGTILHCSSFAVKKDQVSFKVLLTGQEVTLPLTSVANFLRPAEDPKLRTDWDTRLEENRTRDVLAVLREGVVNPLEGTLGQGSDDGTTIVFRLTSGEVRSVPQANVHGFIWQRTPDAKAPPIEFRLRDAHDNLIMGHTAETSDKTLTVVTPAGEKLTYSVDQVAKLDYSKGKLTFLSDLKPSTKVIESASGEKFGHLRLDRGLGDKPMTLNTVPYAKGIAAFTYTELEYDLDGEYHEFRAVVGIDDNVGGSEGPVHLLIEGDGKELLSLTLTRLDMVRYHNVTLNIKDVNKLRIVISDPEKKDIGKHLNLCDLQVRKAAEEE